MTTVIQPVDQIVDMGTPGSTGITIVSKTASQPITITTNASAGGANANIVIDGGTGTVTVPSAASFTSGTAASFTTIPTAAGSAVVNLASTQTLSNKTFVAPVLGAATATSINNLAISAPASTTLTLGGSFTTSGANAITFTTTGTTNLILPTSGTVITNTAASFTDSAFAIDAAGDSTRVIKFTVGNTATLTTLTIASTQAQTATLTIPAVPLGGDIMVTGTATQTLTNKTLVDPSNIIVGGIRESKTYTTVGALAATSTTASVTGTVLTVAATITGTFVPGQVITGAGVTDGSTIISNGTGTGGAGTYNLSLSSAATGSIVVSAATPAPVQSVFTGSITTTTLTVTALISGTIAIGQLISGTGVSANTFITAGSGLSWTVGVSQTVSSTTITGVSGGAAVFTATISTLTTMNVSVITVGQIVVGQSIVTGSGTTTVTAFGSGFGGTGTYTVTSTTNVGSGTTMYASIPSTVDYSTKFPAAGNGVLPTSPSSLPLTVGDVFIYSVPITAQISPAYDLVEIWCNINFNNEPFTNRPQSFVQFSMYRNTSNASTVLGGTLIACETSFLMNNSGPDYGAVTLHGTYLPTSAGVNYFNVYCKLWDAAHYIRLSGIRFTYNIVTIPKTTGTPIYQAFNAGP